MATKYLYGAAVHGIQEFIFNTSKLKEIIGASELVERICTDVFGKYAERGENIIRAAGNVKFLFYQKHDCEKAVYEFPREAKKIAPGIIISQAVVEYDDANEKQFADKINELECKLRCQRNHRERSLLTGFIGIERSRRSGLPVLAMSWNGEFVDLSTKSKLEASGNSRLCKKMFGKDIDVSNHEKFLGENDWLAVIHADGNGLGKVVQKLGCDQKVLAEFSCKLDEATCGAAKAAFESLPANIKNAENIPLRPIVLGGDDFTVVCRADLSLVFVRKFMTEFEERTEKLLGEILEEKNVFRNGRKLTVCIGVAFVKSSYPFHYGYLLAEALCNQSKIDANENLGERELPQSCLSFYKVQDSFVESLVAMQQREQQPSNGHSFVFGPYYLHPKEKRWTIDVLLDKARQISGDDMSSNAMKSGLRRWLSAMHDGVDQASQMKQRLLEITTNKDFVRELTDGERRDGKLCYSVYDMLVINTIMNQKTR